MGKVTVLCDVNAREQRRFSADAQNSRAPASTRRKAMAIKTISLRLISRVLPEKQHSFGFRDLQAAGKNQPSRMRKCAPYNVPLVRKVFCGDVTRERINDRPY
jgi:hypothetical protein